MLVVLEFNFKMKYLTLLSIQNLSFIDPFPMDLTECFSDLLSTYHTDVCLIILPFTHCTKNMLYQMLHFKFLYELLLLCYILLSEPIPE